MRYEVRTDQTIDDHDDCGAQTWTGVKASSAEEAAKECLERCDPDDHDYIPKVLYVREQRFGADWQAFRVLKRVDFSILAEVKK